MTSDNKPRRTTKPLLRLLIVSATVATPEVLMPTQVLAEPGPTVSAARTEILDHHRHDRPGSDSQRHRRRHEHERRETCCAQFIPGRLFCGVFAD
jgi:hypothetical protein